MAIDKKNYVTTNIQSLVEGGYSDGQPVTVEWRVGKEIKSEDRYVLGKVPPIAPPNSDGKAGDYNTGYKPLGRIDFANDKLWFDFQIAILNRKIKSLELQRQNCDEKGNYILSTEGSAGAVARKVDAAKRDATITAAKTMLGMFLATGKTPEEAKQLIFDTVLKPVGIEEVSVLD